MAVSVSTPGAISVSGTPGYNPNLVGSTISGLTGGSSGTSGSSLDPTSFGVDYNRLAREATEEQRAWSAQQAQAQMDFQERMANTQYQRAAADMKAAGLNPYLLMSGAHSSAAPSGAMGTSAAASVYGENDQLTMNLAILEAISGMFSSVLKLFS